MRTKIKKLENGWFHITIKSRKLKRKYEQYIKEKEIKNNDYEFKFRENN